MTVDLKGSEVMTMVRRLEEHSAVLSQLESRVSTVLEEMKQSFCPCVANGKACCYSSVVECAQLASRTSAVMKFGAGGDPLSQVKDLTTNSD